MTAAELEAYLHRHIPISAAMQIAVRSVAPDEVVLEAPLGPNINHRETLFGGSATSLCMLAAWSLVHLRLEASGLQHRLVIQRQTMSYDAPVTGTSAAHARFWPASDWGRSVEMLRRRGKTRLTAVAELRFAEVTAGRMEADFVALGG
jgi:thioesterase domain-containing protein